VRKGRQETLLKIIEEREIETQQDLLLALRAEGFDVTQATVSRDIQELGLEKTSPKGGRSHYIKPQDPAFLKLKTLFKQAVLSFEGVGNFIVIKTISGGANSACLTIDKLNHSQIMGTIAGDDTILVIIRNPSEVQNVIKQFQLLTE
jgi:transcriptional regulator of arginine metabolism